MDGTPRARSRYAEVAKALVQVELNRKLSDDDDEDDEDDEDDDGVADETDDEDEDDR